MPDGTRVRRKVSGRTVLNDALKRLEDELDRGLNTSGTYTVSQTVADWLEGGLPGRSDRTHSVYREASAPLLKLIGTRPLRDLTAMDLQTALEKLSAEQSTRYLQLAATPPAPRPASPRATVTTRHQMLSLTVNGRSGVP
jgi:hypothetical protein